ncbi:uncharacterized protein LOC62_03G003734 [Vanrija pseudolonga]|uniref:Uncharacterized protein n=1 Tax=Vanrija pseudolonga TaxID=143232 RepID=A0AAF0Y6G3_9TREE|nr:hypothetical protein LOC62_03G003734 [Vanrija pseudolonga]
MSTSRRTQHLMMAGMWRSLLATLLVTSAAARVFEPTLLFNLDLGDMSSAVTYVPDFNLPPERASWNTTFSETPSSYVEGMVGKGSALHNSYMVSKFRFTPVVGRFNFVGSGFVVRGSVTGDWTPASSDVNPLLPWVCTVNNYVLRLTPPTNDILVQNSTLPFGYQKIWMALEFGSWSLGAVTIMTGMVAEATSIDNVPTRVESVASKGKINPFFTHKGKWTVSDHIGGVGGQDRIAYDHAVGSSNTGAELSVTLPPRTSYIIINGTTGPTYDKLYINISPAPPLNPASFAWVTTRNKWVSDSIVYAMPLDPRVVYNLSMAPALNSSVALHSITLYSGVGIGKNNATAFDGFGTVGIVC